MHRPKMPTKSELPFCVTVYSNYKDSPQEQIWLQVDFAGVGYNDDIAIITFGIRTRKATGDLFRLETKLKELGYVPVSKSYPEKEQVTSNGRIYEVAIREITIWHRLLA